MSPARALLAALLLCQLLSYGGHQGLTKIFYTLPDAGRPPILISLGDNTKLDFKHPDDLLNANESDQHNDTKTFNIVESEAPSDKDKETIEKETEPTLVFKARPMHERQAEETLQATTPIVEETTESQEEPEQEVPVKSETPQEDIPSFSEWAQKQLAEAERKDTVLNHSSQPSHNNTNVSSKSTKIRSKNYASLVCGAKVSAVNPEAGSPTSILSPNRDEYMLNTCNSRIWFVIELCEAVQAQQIEIANFELFSSTPKDIAVYFSDRFPTREWTSVGQFTAKDIRDVQSFDLFPHLFGKFIKVEMLSHHGSEHYCPISLFKVYGTSEFEVLEKESSQHTAHNDDDEDDEIVDVPDIPAIQTEPSKNLFGSARDAVMSIMKKAAQALVKTEDPNRNASSKHNDTSTDKVYKRCCSPSHIIVCDNCSQSLYNEVYELISCHTDKLTSLVRQLFLEETLKRTGICQQYGLDFKSTKTLEFSAERVDYINALFPSKYLAALCNILAIDEKKVVLNTSFESETNVTVNNTVDEIVKRPAGETATEQEVKLVPDKSNTSTEDKINETVNHPAEPTIEHATENPTTIDLPKKDIAYDNKGDISTVEEKTTETPIDKVLEEKSDIVDERDVLKTEVNYKNNKEQTTERSKDIGLAEEEQILLENDSLMSELDQMAVDPTPAGQPQQAQASLKESVFLRLANRVKTLERNMSLSGQYLEELSRRYKKQVEEMQKTFEKTVVQMTEERRKNNEREQKYLEQVTKMQEQLSSMTKAVSILMEERDSWFGSVTFFKFIVFQCIMIAAVFYYVKKTRVPEAVVLPISKRAKKKQGKFRRKSVEGVSGHETPSAKKRRPSEEALQIARQSAEEELRDNNDEDDLGEWQVARKNRRRKTSILHRNYEKDWCRQDSIRRLQENPITLDEEEFYAPVSEPVEFNEKDAHKEEPPKTELPKTNGSFFNQFKNKTIKTRRLSSPAFLKTLSRQSSRSTPSPVARNLEPIYNGNGKIAASESPTGSLWSESTEISQQYSTNGSGSKKKKSLKNILKKVF